MTPVTFVIACHSGLSAPLLCTFSCLLGRQRPGKPEPPGAFLAELGAAGGAAVRAWARFTISEQIWQAPCPALAVVSAGPVCSLALALQLQGGIPEVGGGMVKPGQVHLPLLVGLCTGLGVEHKVFVAKCGGLIR